MARQQAEVREWSERVRRLLGELKLTQAGLAERLGLSPATVSRWIQGRHEPTAETYIALGNLAGAPDSLYFWERAGIDTSRLPDANIRQTLASLPVMFKDFKVIAAGRTAQVLGGAGQAVAIPLLNATAYGDPVAPKENVSLSQAEVQEILLAPLAWCPHPEKMIAMHISGDSMYPTIPPGSIVFVDTAVTDREKLDQRLTVVAHRDLGFKVARFQRLQGSDLLVSANHKYMPMDVSNASKWKIFGEVLWWVARDAELSP